MEAEGRKFNAGPKGDRRGNRGFRREVRFFWKDPGGAAGPPADSRTRR